METDTDMGNSRIAVKLRSLGTRGLAVFSMGLACLALSAAAGAQITLSVTTMNFGNEAVGLTSAAKKVTLTNAGTTTVTFSSFTTSGPFAESATTCASLKAAKTCTVSVTFSPLATGTFTGTLTITDTASNSPQTVALSGNGVTGVTLSPTKLTFPSTPVGTSSAPLVSTLSNNDTTVLTINSITITGNYSQTNTCGSSLAAGTKCTISVVFTPQSTGTLTGVVTITEHRHQQSPEN